MSDSSRPERARKRHHTGPENRLELAQRRKDTSGGWQPGLDMPLCRCYKLHLPESLRDRANYHCDFEGCFFANDRAARLSTHEDAHVENPGRAACWRVSAGAGAPRKHRHCRFRFHVYDRHFRVEARELRRKPRADSGKSEVGSLGEPSAGDALQRYSDRLVKPDMFTSISPSPLYATIRNALGTRGGDPRAWRNRNCEPSGGRLPTR